MLIFFVDYSVYMRREEERAQPISKKSLVVLIKKRNDEEEYKPRIINISESWYSFFSFRSGNLFRSRIEDDDSPTNYRTYDETYAQENAWWCYEPSVKVTLAQSTKKMLEHVGESFKSLFSYKIWAVYVFLVFVGFSRVQIGMHGCFPVYPASKLLGYIFFPNLGETIISRVCTFLDIFFIQKYALIQLFFW